MRIVEMNKILQDEMPKVKGIIDKKANKQYLKGENPFMDMQIENYLLCPSENETDWFGFNKTDYELVYC
ncbi:MAG: hypothetical protein PHY15_08555 [Eubacteriales bacterium]|nr:hypothetical protein [Eubacteriales bacterium]